MSQTADDQYSISVVQDGEVRHIRVLNAEGGFVIKFVFNNFTSASLLINFSSIFNLTQCCEDFFYFSYP